MKNLSHFNVNEGVSMRVLRVLLSVLLALALIPAAAFASISLRANAENTSASTTTEETATEEEQTVSGPDTTPGWTTNKTEKLHAQRAEEQANSTDSNSSLNSADSEAANVTNDGYLVTVNAGQSETGDLQMLDDETGVWKTMVTPHEFGNAVSYSMKKETGTDFSGLILYITTADNLSYQLRTVNGTYSTYWELDSTIYTEETSETELSADMAITPICDHEIFYSIKGPNITPTNSGTITTSVTPTVFHNCTAAYTPGNFDSKGTLDISYNSQVVCSYDVTPADGYQIKNVWVSTDAAGTTPVSSRISSDIYINGRFTKGNADVALTCNPTDGGTFTYTGTELTTKAFEIGSTYSISNNTITITDLDGKTTTASALADTDNNYLFSGFTDASGAAIESTGTITAATTFRANFDKYNSVSVDFEAGVGVTLSQTLIDKGWTVSTLETKTTIKKLYKTGTEISKAVEEINECGLTVTKDGVTWQGVYYDGEETYIEADVALSNIYTFKISCASSDAYSYEFDDTSASTYEFTALNYALDEEDGVIAFTNGQAYVEGEIEDVDDFTLTVTPNEGATFAGWATPEVSTTPTALKANTEFKATMAVELSVGVDPEESGSVVIAGTETEADETYSVEFGDTSTVKDNVVSFKYFDGNNVKHNIQLTGVAAEGYTLSQITATSTFGLSGNKVTANFTKQKYTLTIKTSNAEKGLVQKGSETATESFTLSDIEYETPWSVSSEGLLTIGQGEKAVACNNVPTEDGETTMYYFVNWTVNNEEIDDEGTIESSTTFVANFKCKYPVTVKYGAGSPKNQTTLGNCGWAYDTGDHEADQWFDENTNLKTDIFENDEVWTDGCEATRTGYTAKFDSEPSGVLTGEKTYTYVYSHITLQMSAEAYTNPKDAGQEGGTVVVEKPTTNDNATTYDVYYGDNVKKIDNNLQISTTEDSKTTVKYTLVPKANENGYWKFSQWHAYKATDTSHTTDILSTVMTNGITEDTVFVAEFVQNEITLSIDVTNLGDATLYDGSTKITKNTNVSIPMGYKWSTSKSAETLKHADTLTVYSYEGTVAVHTYKLTGGTEKPYVLFADADAQILDGVDKAVLEEDFTVYPTGYDPETDTVTATASVYDSSISQVKCYNSSLTEISSISAAKPIKYEKQATQSGVETLEITSSYGNTFYIKASKTSEGSSSSFIGWAYKAGDATSYSWLSDSEGYLDKNVDFKAVFAGTLTVNFDTVKDASGNALGKVSTDKVTFSNVETTKITAIENTDTGSVLTITNEDTAQSEKITATANEHNYFTQWQNASGTAYKVGDTVSAGATIYAKFTKGYAARMNASDNGGSFGALPSGWSKTTIDGTTYAEKYYISETSISTITGEWKADYLPVKTGYTFNDWTQNPTGTTLTADTIFTATYTANKVPVTVYMKGGAVSSTASMGNWTPDSSKTSYTNKEDFTYDQATSVATADFVAKAESITRDGFTFTGNFSTDNTTGKLGLSNNNFVCLYSFTISFDKNIADGGTVTPSSEISGIAEETPVTATVKSDDATKLILTYSDGKTDPTTITATPATGYDFAGWTIGGTTITTSTTIGSNSTIVANFVLHEYTVDATANKYTNYDQENKDAGYVTVSPTAATATHFSTITENATTHVITIKAPDTYSTKSNITITPTALANYKFTGWTVKDASGAKVASMPETYDQDYSFEANYDVDTVAFTVSPYKIGSITVVCDEYHGSSDKHTQTLPTAGGTINVQKNSVVTMRKIASENIPAAIVITEPSGNIHTLKLTCASSLDYTLLWMHNEDSTNKVLQAGYSTTITADSTFLESGYINNEVCSVGYAPQSSSLGKVELADTTSPATELNFVYTGAVATVSAYNATGANTITVSRTNAPTGTITITATPNSGSYAFLGWKAVAPDGTKTWIEYGTNLGATSYTINDNVTFEAEFAQTCVVTAEVSDVTKGSISPTSITVPVGSQYAVNSEDSNIVTIKNNDGGLGYFKTITVTPGAGNYVASWTENGTSTTTGGTINSATKLTANLETTLYNVKFVSSNVDYGEVKTIPTDNPQQMLYGATLSFDGSGLTKAFQVKDKNTTFTGTASPYGNDQYTCKFDHWTIKYADGTTERVEADASFPATDTPAAHQAVYGDVEIEAFFTASYTKYDISADIDTGDYDEPEGEESTLTFVPSTLSQLNYGTLFWSEGDTIYFMEREAEEAQTITINHGEHSTFTGWTMFYYDEAYDEDMVDGQVYKLEDSMKFTANVVEGAILRGYVQEAFTGYVIPDATVTFTYDDEAPTNIFAGLFATVAHADADKVVTTTDANGYYEFSDPCLIVGKSGTLTVERDGYDTVSQHIDKITSGDVDLTVKTDAYSGTMDLFSESRGHDYFVLAYNGTIGSKTIEEAEIYRTFPAAQNKEIEGKDKGTTFTVTKDTITTSYTTTTDAHSTEVNATEASAVPATYSENSTITPVAKEGWEFVGFSLNGHTLGEGESFEIDKDKVYNIKAEYVSTGGDASGTGKTGDSLPWIAAVAFAMLLAGGFTYITAMRRRDMRTVTPRHAKHARR